VTIDLQWTTLACDGHTKIFLTDYNNGAVHMCSVNGQYVCQLLSSQQLVSSPQRLAVDTGFGHVMYLGKRNGIVEIYELT
jgi:hypothetical protein